MCTHYVLNDRLGVLSVWWNIHPIYSEVIAHSYQPQLLFAKEETA
jgi:hypothetical protein